MNALGTRLPCDEGKPRTGETAWRIRQEPRVERSRSRKRLRVV